jgi:hypothetical protein
VDIGSIVGAGDTGGDGQGGVGHGTVIFFVGFNVNYLL